MVQMSQAQPTAHESELGTGTFCMSRIIIEQVESGLFYKEPDQWVETRQEATDFETSAKAREFCTEHHLQRIRLLMDFGDPRYDVWLTVV